jgi:hypothetical protein
MDHSLDVSIKQLSSAFYKATRGAGEKAVHGTNLFKLQVEFAYLVDSIKRGPAYIAPKLISVCNEFINVEVPRSIAAAQVK